MNAAITLLLLNKDKDSITQPYMQRRPTLGGSTSIHYTSMSSWTQSIQLIPIVVITILHFTTPTCFDFSSLSHF